MSVNYSGPLSQRPTLIPDRVPHREDLLTPIAMVSTSAGNLVYTGQTRLGWIFIKSIAATVILEVYDDLDGSTTPIFLMDENGPPGMFNLNVAIKTGIYVIPNPLLAVEYSLAYV